MSLNEIQQQLFAWQDIKYRDFHRKLIPNISSDTVIGVRTPILRKYAKELTKSGNVNEFFKALPHTYFEENQLHAFLLAEIKDYDTLLEETKRFLPYIDNWATCDQLRSKTFQKHTDRLLAQVYEWLTSDEVYTVRFGLGMLNSYFLDEAFDTEQLERASQIQSEEYYVNMMIAWYFATALANQYEATIPYLEEQRLSTWVHNKTIQKARESLRITEETKEYLKELKR